MSDSTHPYRFRFTLRPAKVGSIIVGLLELVGADSGQINAYRASSSSPGRQYHRSWNERGGLIPPGTEYSVCTTPEMSDLDGIQGEFYRISPYDVPTEGVDRAAFGLHKDANASRHPGTMGCIFPISENGWTAIKRDLKNLSANGVEKIGLEVRYLAK